MKMKNILFSLFLLLIVGCQNVETEYDGLLMTGTESNEFVKFAIDEQESYAVSVTSTVCVQQDVKVNIDVDDEALTKYNAKYSTQYVVVPQNAYKLESKEVIISAGQSVSSSALVSIVNREELQEGVAYVIPISIKSVDSNMDVIETNRTIFLKLSKTILFAAPFVGTTATTRNFLWDEDDIVTGIQQYTWEVKFKAETFDRRVKSEPIKLGGVCNSMLRFGEAGNPGNILEVYVYAGTEHKLIAKTEFMVNTWYMLSIVNDGKTLTLYVNGIKDNSMAVAPSEYQFGGVEIGQSLKGYESAQLFHGWLGGMRCWSRALSAREIRTNLCGVNPNAEGLEAYYKMNEGEGNVFYDSTPHQRHLQYPENINVGWTEVENKCVE